MRVWEPEGPFATLSRLDLGRLDPFEVAEVALEVARFSRGVLGVLLDGVTHPEALGVLEADVGFEPIAAPCSKLSESLDAIGKVKAMHTFIMVDTKHPQPGQAITAASDKVRASRGTSKTFCVSRDCLSISVVGAEPARLS